jgi:hypothetical protein
LNAVAARITANVEPQHSAYDALIDAAEEAQNFEPDPPVTMNIMGGYEPNSNLSEMRAWLWRESHSAYASALAYRYSGDERYAQKAREILNAWAEQGTVFTGGDRGLQLGSWFSGMLYAADLLRDFPAWTDTEQDTFESWWRAEVLVHTYSVMTRDNNWGDAGLLGVLAAAATFDDQSLLMEGIERLESYFDGDWKIRKDASGTYLPAEVTRNDGTSGITYTAYAFTTMVQALEIARYAGYDFWHHQTPDGATLQEVIEWYFRWNNLDEPFPWNADPNQTSSRQNTFEIANNHFDFDVPIRTWLQDNRPVNGEQGDRYATLNKGDLDPDDIGAGGVAGESGVGGAGGMAAAGGSSDGGTGGVGTGGSGVGGSAGSSSDAGPTAGGTDDDTGGCGCRIKPGTEGSLGMLMPTLLSSFVAPSARPFQ